VRRTQLLRQSDAVSIGETAAFERSRVGALRSTRIRQARFSAYKTAALPLSYAGVVLLSLPARTVFGSTPAASASCSRVHPRSIRSHSTRSLASSHVTVCAPVE